MPHSDLISRIERLVGSKVRSYQTVEGGYTPATRLLCNTDTTRFFAKAGATPLTSEFLRREICAYQRISGPFMPTLIAWEEHESEPILLIEDLSNHHWPPPWDDRRVELVLSQIATMHSTKIPLEPYVQVRGKRGSSWQKVAEDPRPFLSIGIADEPWLQRALPILISNEAQCQTEGDSLTHWDLRSDNMCLTNEKAIFIDWNNACLSNPKLDLGFWLPSLAYEGGPLPERIMPDAPEIAAWVSGFFAARAGLPGVVGAPRVRLVQRQQLETALPWVVRALGLPPPITR
jgi:thiamine kinase-like enzyme